MLLVILMVNKLLECKKLQKTNQEEYFSVEKVINRKGDKLYVHWESYNSFTNWIHKKEVV